MAIHQISNSQSAAVAFRGLSIGARLVLYKILILHWHSHAFAIT